MVGRRLRLHASRTLGCLLLFSLLPLTTHALTHADCERQYMPRSGEPGKDVMWVATLDEVVTAMLRVARVTSKDRVVDLGSGDGKIPIAAAKQFGASAVGIEYNPQLVQLAQCRAQVEQVTDKVRFEQGDIFESDFSDATVLTLYLGPTVNLRLRPKLLSMRPGTRIVSNAFDMADWQPDERIEPDIGNTMAYLWIVPARIDGEWRFTEVGGKQTFGLKLQQRFQKLEPSPATGSRLAVRGGRLLGNQVEIEIEGLEAQPVKLTGEVSGDRLLVGLMKDGITRRYVGAPM
jgi:SAM-dependent methyltransferase